VGNDVRCKRKVQGDCDRARGRWGEIEGGRGGAEARREVHGKAGDFDLVRVGVKHDLGAAVMCETGQVKEGYCIIDYGFKTPRGLYASQQLMDYGQPRTDFGWRDLACIFVYNL
jgi:hypothetical protein